MAIQVNGTTVIDNSRALTNISTVDAATAAAIGAAGIGGNVDISVTAGSSLSAYEPVYYDPSTTSYKNLESTYGVNPLFDTTKMVRSYYKTSSTYQTAYNPDSGVILTITYSGSDIYLHSGTASTATGKYAEYNSWPSTSPDWALSSSIYTWTGTNYITEVGLLYVGNNKFLVWFKTNSGYNSWGEARVRLLQFDGSSSTGTWLGSGWTLILAATSGSYMNDLLWVSQDKKNPTNFIMNDGGQDNNSGAYYRGLLRTFKVDYSTNNVVNTGSQFHYHYRASSANYGSIYAKPIYHDGHWVQPIVMPGDNGGYPDGVYFKYIKVNSNGYSIDYGQDYTTYKLWSAPSYYSYAYYQYGMSQSLCVLNNQICWVGPYTKSGVTNTANIGLYKFNFSGGNISFGVSYDTGDLINSGNGYFTMPMKLYTNGTETDVYVDTLNGAPSTGKIFRWNGTSFSLADTTNANIVSLPFGTSLVAAQSYWVYPIYSASDGSVAGFVANYSNGQLRAHQFAGYSISSLSFAGFAQSSVSAGSTTNVRVFGVSNTTKTDLVKGQFYTVNSFGDYILATDANTSYGTALGKAVSNSQMLVGLQG